MMKEMLLSSVPFLAGACGSISIAKSSDIFKERRLHGSCALMSASVALLLLGLLSSATIGPVVSFALLTFGSFSAGGYHGPVVTWPQDFQDPEVATRTFSIMNSMGCIGAAIGPLVFGMLKDTTETFSSTYLYCGIVLVSSGALVAFFRPEGRPYGSPYVELAVEPRQGPEDASRTDTELMTATSSSLGREVSGRRRSTRGMAIGGVSKLHV